MKVLVTRRVGLQERYAVVSVPPRAAGEACPPPLHGQVLENPPPRSRDETHGPPWLVVVCGPDSGGSFPLPPGRWLTIGRDPLCDITLEDTSLSRRHARVRQERDAVRVDDLGSTNGATWELDGESPQWRPGDRLLLGGSSLTLLGRGPALATTRPGGGGTLVVTPWPRAFPERRAVVLERPARPTPRTVRAPSAWTWALPLLVAVAVAGVLRMPWLLLFGLLGPAMAFGQHLGDRRTARIEHGEALQAWVAACARVQEQAAGALRADLEMLRERDPGPAVATWALLPRPTARLWECTGEPVRVVLGDSSAPSAITLDGEVLQHTRAPLVVDLGAPLVLAGPREPRDALARSLVLQLAARHPPSEVAVQVDPRAPGTGWDLLAWLPHCHLGEPPPGRPILRWGRDLLLVDDLADAPAGATCVVVHDPHHAVLHRPGAEPLPFAPALMGLARARRLARALAPLRPGRDQDGTAGTLSPSAARLGDLLPWPDDAEQALSAWLHRDAPTGPSSLAVPLGLDPDGRPLVVDLITDGPHALVAGTTGSGKSELLRTLVAGWALRCPPSELSMLLVDYKGGSSLGECSTLPHVVGLVTDLDPQLADRVLVSLQAELRRREQVLHAHGARDIREDRGHGLPRLVVVIDEFRVLAEEVPEVLAGLVRLAAVGRSLGVHLVLATQRPAGVVSADLRANVNLRIALRVRDLADSHDVLESADAAHLPEGRPGLALLRTGADPPRTVQVAVAGPGARCPAASPVSSAWSRGAPASSPAAPAAATASPSDSGSGSAPNLPATVWQVEDHDDIWSARRAVDETSTTATADVPVDAVARLSAVLTAAADRLGVMPDPVWVPPLPARLGTVADHPTAWVVTDRPELQRHDPDTWTARQHLGVVGAPGSGRSTALRSVAGRLGASWLVVLDLGRTLAGTELADHPGRCAWVAPDDLAHGLRVLDLLLEVVLARQHQPDEQHPALVVLVDGWDRFVDLYEGLERGRALDVMLRILREGPTVGVVGLLSGDRSLLVGRLATLIPETWALRLHDPGDLLLTGLSARQVPREQPPGRVVRTRDGVVGQVVLPEPASPDGLGMPPPTAPPAPRPLRCETLPLRWTLADGAAVDKTPADRPRAGWVSTVGSPSPWALGGDDAAPIPPPPGSVLVLGPPRSGRTAALSALAAARGGVALVVDGAAPPEDPQLVAALAVLPPDGLLVVDDAHLLSGTSTEDLLLDHLTRHRAPVLLAADLDSAASAFRGLVPLVARARTGVILQPTTPGQGSLLGASLPVGDHAVPGRGVLVQQGRCQRIQVVAPS